jgi:hypothetical protein
MSCVPALTLIVALSGQAALVAADQQPPVPKPAIAALPNPVPADPNIRGTTITWSTGDGTDGVVHVSVDGGAEQVFAQGASGSSPANWIDAERTYEFRLYLVADPARVVAKVSVTRERGKSAPAIDVSPNPVPAGTGLATATVTWTTGDQSDGEVYVSRAGDAERLLTRGPSGSVAANWIDRTVTYQFRLYVLPSKRLAAEVTLRSSAAPPPAATAAPAAASEETTGPSRNLSAYLLWGAVIALFVIAFLRRQRKAGTPPRT